MRIQILILGFKGLKLKFELRMYRLYGFLDTLRPKNLLVV